MDIIKLDSPFDRIDFIKSNKILWKAKWKNYKKRLIYILISSIVILVIGLIGKSEKEPSNPFIFIGIGSLLIYLIVAFAMFCSWNNYNQKLKKIADKLEESKTNIIFELSQDSFKYWDYEKHYDLKWSVFSHFTIYQDNIILFVNNSIIGGYIFSKNDLEIDRFENILEVVKTKLEYKEIK